MAESSDSRRQRLEELRRQTEAKAREADKELADTEARQRTRFRQAKTLDNVVTTLDEELALEEARKEKVRKSQALRDEKLQALAAAEEENRKKQAALQAMIDALQGQVSSASADLSSASDEAARTRAEVEGEFKKLGK